MEPPLKLKNQLLIWSFKNSSKYTYTSIYWTVSFLHPVLMEPNDLQVFSAGEAEAGIRAPGPRTSIPGYEQPRHEHSPFDTPVWLPLLLEVVCALCCFYHIVLGLGTTLQRLYKSLRGGVLHLISFLIKVLQIIRIFFHYEATPKYSAEK